jgi:hypothetical protein
MAKIELYFGHPQKEKTWDGVENHAYNQDVNIETAVIRGFQAINSVLTRKDPDKDTYFELVLISWFGVNYKLPNITTGVYKERGFVFPKLVIHGDNCIDKNSGERIFISDKFINCIGKDFDNDFDFEYFGFKRYGKANPVTEEVIYHLRNKPHIYHEGNFIEIKEPKSV